MKRKSYSEANEQTAIVEFFRLKYARWKNSLRISQSGAFRGAGATGRNRMAMAKAQGVVTGESDLAILLQRGGYPSLLLEHKPGGRLRRRSEDVLEFLGYLGKVGNAACVTRGVDAAQAAIDCYMAGEWPPRRAAVQGGVYFLGADFTAPASSVAVTQSDNLPG